MFLFFVYLRMIRDNEASILAIWVARMIHLFLDNGRLNADSVPRNAFDPLILCALLKAEF